MFKSKGSDLWNNGTVKKKNLKDVLDYIFIGLYYVRFKFLTEFKNYYFLTKKCGYLCS